MVFFNWATMQMAAKIVYYGPGLCGKTSNLSHIYAKTSPGSRGEMVSLETESDRTLFFDLLPIEVGTIGGFKTRLQLYTVPGQVFYNTTRKLVLKGVDGMVFVADSQRPMREANKESFAGLRENLEELGLDLSDVPLVLQYNKRDLPSILTVEELNEDINPDLGFSFHESSATNGDGVFETLKDITKLTLKKLRKRMTSPQEEPAAPPTSTRISAPAPTPKTEKPRTILASALARAAEEGVDSGGGMPAMAPAPEMADSQASPAVAIATEPLPIVETREEPLSAVPNQQQIEVTPPEEILEVEVLEEPAEVEILEAPAEAVQETQEDPFEAEQLDESTEVEELAEVVEIEVQEKDEDPTADDSFADSELTSTPAPQEEPDTDRPTDAEVEEVPDTSSPDEELADFEAPVVDFDCVPGPEVEPEPEVFQAESKIAEPDPPEETEISQEQIEEDREVRVEFDQTDPHIESADPPPVKRVQVSNQMDILAELDGLRKQATMSSTASSEPREADLDLDALLSPSPNRRRRVSQRVEHALNSDIFKNMSGLQLAIRIQNEDGETIHTLEPVSCKVKKAKDLETLSVLLTIDLENTQ
ncbi:MAG: hypothetical protein GY906_07000 [bacterium]|nr:hypothetical protein [bacterium]